jgi:hypothetical protein
MFKSFLTKAKIIEVKVLMVRHIEWLPAGSNKKVCDDWYFTVKNFHSFSKFKGLYLWIVELTFTHKHT